MTTTPPSPWVLDDAGVPRAIGLIRTHPDLRGAGTIRVGRPGMPAHLDHLHVPDPTIVVTIEPGSTIATTGTVTITSMDDATIGTTGHGTTILRATDSHIGTHRGHIDVAAGTTTVTTLDGGTIGTLADRARVDEAVMGTIRLITGSATIGHLHRSCDLQEASSSCVTIETAEQGAACPDHTAPVCTTPALWCHYTGTPIDDDGRAHPMVAVDRDGHPLSDTHARGGVPLVPHPDTASAAAGWMIHPDGAPITLLDATTASEIPLRYTACTIDTLLPVAVTSWDHVLLRPVLHTTAIRP